MLDYVRVINFLLLPLTIIYRISTILSNFKTFASWISQIMAYVVIKTKQRSLERDQLAL